MSNSVRIGPYTLGRTLGIGSFCKVKLAVHELTGQKVAVKILNRKKLRKMDMGAKVRTEIEIIRLFMHPHIIRLYEVIDTPTDIFSIMEYVPGGELFDYIVSKGRLEESEARRLFQEIISGVEYCHSHRVVHRDLKPENLLLDANHHVKIADFGSPNYAAPEVISGSLYAGPEVDVWSCGVILYAILCGSLPFDDENIRSLFRKIKGGIYTIPSCVSGDARDLLTSMLKVDPLQRISMPEIRAHKWFRQDLPPYLQLSAEQQTVRTQLVDQPTLNKVVQFGFNREKVLAALAMGHDLLTSRRMVEHVHARQMAVVYNLLLDRKRRKEQEIHQRSGSSMISSPGFSPSFPSSNARLGISSMSPIVTVASPPYIPACPRVASAVLAPAPYEIRRWSIGCEFFASPEAIMNQLFRSLRRHNFEWKVLSSYKIKARFPVGLVVPTGDHIKQNSESKKLIASSENQAGAGSRDDTLPPNTRRAASSEVLKITVGLFKSGAGKGKNQFVVDLTKLYGQAFTFLDLGGRLVGDLCSNCLSTGHNGKLD